jgi:hypothetical protein
MNLHAPSMWIFVLSVLIAVLAIVSAFTPIQYVSTYAFWVAIIAFIVLAFGNLVKRRPGSHAAAAPGTAGCHRVHDLGGEVWAGKSAKAGTHQARKRARTYRVK